MAVPLLSFVLDCQPAWRLIRTQLFLMASIPVVAMGAFLLMLPHDGKFGPGVLAGLFGRLLLASSLVWRGAVQLFLLGVLNPLVGVPSKGTVRNGTKRRNLLTTLGPMNEL